MEDTEIGQCVNTHQAFKWFKENHFNNIPPYFLTHWKTNKKFFQAHHGLLAYEETSKYLVVAGEPLMAEDEEGHYLKKAFFEFAKRKNKKICGYYVSDEWHWTRFSKVPLGTSIYIPLQSYDFQSPKARETRRALRKGHERKYQVIEADHKHQSEILKLHKVWKKHKLPLRIKFFLSSPLQLQLQPQLISTPELERKFIVKKDGECLAYCSLVPYLSHGKKCFYIDHLIYHPEKEKQSLSFLVSYLIKTLKEQNIAELNLGLNPFAHNTPGKGLARFFDWLYFNPFYYKPKKLYYFKSKFSGIEKTQYCFYEQSLHPIKAVLGLARVTLFSR